MIAFLERAGVIDEAGHWSWGDGHLVVVGDLVDRGEHVTECLWFLHGLERQAEQAGGRVHIVLGNHEAMVMRGDIRYTHAKYTGGIVRYSGVRYPDLFGPDMELGRWLRSKPFVLKLNDIVFVHGGLGPDVVVRDLDLATINEVGRTSLGLSSVALTFSDLPGFLLGSRGPLWYRGYFMGRDGYPVASPTEIDAVLHHLDASALVVGHTSIGRVGRFHDGRVFAVDVSLDELGTFEGLLWEDGAFSVVTGTGEIHELR